MGAIAHLWQFLMAPIAHILFGLFTWLMLAQSLRALRHATLWSLVPGGPWRDEYINVISPSCVTFKPSVYSSAACK